MPIQQPGGKKADGRMLYTTILYIPDKSRSHNLVDFDLNRLAGQMRRAAVALGLGAADRLIAISDAGNGLIGLPTKMNHSRRDAATRQRSAPTTRSAGASRLSVVTKVMSGRAHCQLPFFRLISVT